MTVKRYDPINSDGTCGICVEEPGYGAYVEFADYDALLSINAGLLEAFETATKGVISMVVELELGRPATDAQIEKTIQLAKPGSLVGDMVAALAKARSAS
ncbi:hypothetical protein [Bowmanella yangjiangensis]|uniref:Uncharacterized protein n=1 Tax=Bowmanella yangjiangensis TaxID=2811230 RepID=A0ABS3CYL2_9ALTE|nr:hypothetical protein [Bowmanella yangjiangensis]MBN7822218.1 hypothetical protein [Bowmanella yangjiangensis]